MHTVSGQARLHRVQLDWVQTSTKLQHGQPLQSPTCQAQRLKILHDFFPTTDSDGPNYFESNLFTSTSSSRAYLTHLQLIPPGPGNQSPEALPPTIIGVFSHIPSQSGDTQLREEPFSVISRWEMQSRPSTLHPVFDQLASKKSNTSSAAKIDVSDTVSTSFFSFADYLHTTSLSFRSRSSLILELVESLSPCTS